MDLYLRFIIASENLVCWRCHADALQLSALILLS
jgi:hypothetical protein